MARISRPQLWMMMARAASLRATCFRLNVGCVIVEDDRKVVSVGYNGVPPGQPHCIGNNCPGEALCNLTIHAEKNALSKLDYDIMVGKEYDLYTTHSPCAACCHAIEWYPIRTVFFEAEYRDTSHLVNFQDQWNLYQITPAGYITNWFTKRVVEVV